MAVGLEKNLLSVYLPKESVELPPELCCTLQ